MENDVHDLIEVMEKALKQMPQYGEIGFTTDIFEFFAERLQSGEGEKALRDGLHNGGTEIDPGAAISAAVSVLGAVLALREKH